MDEQKKVLLKILDAVDFKDDKESFAGMLIDLIMEESIYLLMKSLPAAKKKKYKSKWEKNEMNPAARISMLKHLFTEEQIQTTTQKATAKALKAFLTVIAPTPSQMIKLQKVMQQVQNNDKYYGSRIR